ncbi:MAG: hypothetical protein LBG78_05525 [Azoarcus sp.]|jgi:hypothetical protein|nr:hypothetical protein [Azoarcus sp.]
MTKANKYTKHLKIIAEDDSCRQLANGLMNVVSNNRAIDSIEISDGWLKSFDFFSDKEIERLKKFNNRILLLIIDSDNNVDSRFKKFKEKVPDEFKDRVYLLSSKGESEDLRSYFKSVFGKNSLELIGEKLAESCHRGKFDLWNCDQLKHNKPEIHRFYDSVKTFLCPNS